MKNVLRILIFIFIIISIIVLGMIISIISKNNNSSPDYGYFVPVNYLNRTHYAADAIKLNNEQILVVGNDLSGIPSEIYNRKDNSVNFYIFPNNLKVNKRGISLGNNKILLLDTCDFNKSACRDFVKDYMGNITVYDTNLKKIVSSNSLKLSYQSQIVYDFFCLNDGRVFFIISYLPIKQKSKTYFVIYNFKTNKMIFSKEIPELDIPKGIQINKNEILILQNNGPIMKYNIQNNELIKMKSKNPVNNSIYTKIGKNYILICGTKEPTGASKNENYLYDFSKDKITRIGQMNYERMYGEANFNVKLPYNLLPIDSTRVLITGGNRRPKWWYTHVGIRVDEAEIYDLDKNEFIPIGKSNYTHNRHNMIKLNNNEIILIGGYDTYKRISDIQSGSKDKSWIEVFKINEKIKE